MRLSTSLAVLAFIGGSQAQKINCNAVANVVNALKILKTAEKFCTSFNKVKSATVTTTSIAFSTIKETQITTTTSTYTTTEVAETCGVVDKRKRDGRNNRRHAEPAPTPAPAPLPIAAREAAADALPYALEPRAFCNGAPVGFACSAISTACSCIATTRTKTVTTTSTQPTTITTTSAFTSVVTATVTTTTVTAACAPVFVDTCPPGGLVGTTCGFTNDFQYSCYCIDNFDGTDNICVALGPDSVDARNSQTCSARACSSNADCVTKFGAGFECSKQQFGACNAPACVNSGACKQQRQVFD